MRLREIPFTWDLIKSRVIGPLISLSSVRGSSEASPMESVVASQLTRPCVRMVPTGLSALPRQRMFCFLSMRKVNAESAVDQTDRRNPH
jgi:hypothetical protein